MTPLDGFLMIAGFAWGCLPIIECLIERRSLGFKRSPQRLARTALDLIVKSII